MHGSVLPRVEEFLEKVRVHFYTSTVLVVTKIYMVVTNASWRKTILLFHCKYFRLLSIKMCFDIGVVHCGPSEAMVVSGVGYGDKPCIICGGRAIVIPCLHKVQRISLRIMTLTVSSPRVYTVKGVPISVHGIAQVKISGSNEDMLRYFHFDVWKYRSSTFLKTHKGWYLILIFLHFSRCAAEQFGDKEPSEIEHIIKETLEGHQREIMAHMTVEEIYRKVIL